MATRVWRGRSGALRGAICRPGHTSVRHTDTYKAGTRFKQRRGAYRSAVPTLPLRSLPRMPLGFGLVPVGAGSTRPATIEEPEAVERMLASLPERVRRLRWADAAAWRMGPEDFIAESGEAAPAREDFLRRRRGRDSSAEATEMDGRAWDSFAWNELPLAEAVAGAPVGVLSSGERLATAARGVVGVPGRGVCAGPGAGARRPEEKKEE